MFIAVIFVASIWLTLLYFLGYFLAFFIKNKAGRKIFGFIFAALLCAVPFVDEIIGEREFEALCEVGGNFKISPKAEGRKFVLEYSSTEDVPLVGYTRPVRVSTISYHDVETGETIATANAYYAGGGWLVRNKIMVLTSTNGPLLGRSQCFPSAEQLAPLRAITLRFSNS